MTLIGQKVVCKVLAHTQCITCSACAARRSYAISRERTWLTLFRIPVFPRSTRYSYSCPACGNSHPLVRQQVTYMVKRADKAAQ